jgi:hypothetical protein
MKIYIISDLNSDVESVIPYGLRFAKFIEKEVDILHPIDPRTLKGAYTSISDSQSISPGSKLSSEALVEREKKNADTGLKKILSAEGSRLNYPLKINTVIEENDIESMLGARIENDHESIFIINTKTSNGIFDSTGEIIDIVKKLHAIYLLVHPGQVFHEYERVILPTNFTQEDLEKYPKVSFLFKGFEPNINAVDVGKNEEYLGTEMKSSRWEAGAKAVFNDSTITSTMLNGNDYNATLVKYLLKDKPDLVLLFKKEKNLFEKLFKKDLMKDILEKTDVPVMFYSSD